MVVWCGWGLFRAGGANRGTDTIFGSAGADGLITPEGSGAG